MPRRRSKSKQQQFDFSKFIIYSANYVNFVSRHHSSQKHQPPNATPWVSKILFLSLTRNIYIQKIKRVKTRLILVHRGAGIVLVAPGPVPDTGDEHRGNEHNGSIVDCLGCDGDDSRHAKQRHGKQGPGCETYQVSQLLSNTSNYGIDKE